MKENKEHTSNKFYAGKSYLPLYNFFSALRQNNFLVTPKQITDSNSVIAEYAPLVKNENELCNYLSPIFANSPEEQVQFRQIFDEYFKEKVELPSEELTFWQKTAKHIKKYKWKYAWLTLLILTAIIYLTYAPKLDVKPVIAVTVVKDSTGKKGAMKLLLSIDNASPDSAPGIKLKTIYHWGDGTEVASLTYHNYTAEGSFLVTAYSDVFYKDHFQYTDTSQSLATVCFTNTAIKIDPAINNDTINVYQKIKLQTVEQSGNINRLEWTDFKGDSTVEFRAENDAVFYSFKTEGPQTIFCTAVVDSLASPCSVKDSVSFFVYDTKPKPTVALSIAPGATIIQPKYKVKSKWFYIVAALGIGSLFFTSFFALRRSRLKKKRKENDIEIKEEYQKLLQSFSGQSGPVNLLFQNKNYLPLPEEDISEVARRMRKRINDDATFLHLPKTIEKTVVNAGFFLPVHANRTQQSEYLILIDEQFNNSQQVKLFEYLLELLAKQNVFIEKYYYKQHPLQCYSAAQPSGITLEKLSEKYPRHILLIMGNAHQLIYNLYPVIDSSYLPILSRWQYKAVLTPVSFLDWGNKEKKVLLDELPVLPVDITGQLLLLQKLFGEEINILADLKQYSNSFYETELVDFENVDELLEYCTNAAWANIALNDKYSNILFQWIAALAVYPKIHWELTLAIGKNILDKYGKGNELNFTNLLRITRIRWMVTGQFPDYTRLGLLKKLSRENEIIARETILTLLNEIPEEELNVAHFAYEEKETQRLINEFNLFAYDPVKYAPYKISKELISEMWTNQQITDAPVHAYIDNKELQWDTLINKPCKPGETIADTKNVAADDYFGTSSNTEGLLAKLYLWATSISAVVFVASLIGLLALIILNFSNKGFGSVTDRGVDARTIKINYTDSTITSKADNVILQVDTAQIFLDPMQPATLLLPVDNLDKQVSIIADDVKLFDSLMPFSYDSYNISLGSYPVALSYKINVTLQLSDGCASNIQNYTTIINEADTGFTVNTSMVNENGIAASKLCLTSIVAGSKVASQKLDKLIEAFRNAGTYLKPGVTSKYFAAANEIVIYNEYDPVPPVVKPVVVIQISDNSLAKNAAVFRKDLGTKNFTVRPVSIQNYNYNSEVSYYDNSIQKEANTVTAIWNAQNPGVKVQARLRKAPDAGNYKNIIAVWIKKPANEPVAQFDIENAKFPSSVIANQKISVAFNIVNTTTGKTKPGKVSGKICILSEQTCSDFTFNAADISTAINQQISISNKQLGSHEIRILIDELKINKSLGYFTIIKREDPPCDTIHYYLGTGKGGINFNRRLYNKTARTKDNVLFTLVERNNQYTVVEVSKDKCPAQRISFYIGKPQSFSLCDGTKISFTLLNWQNKDVPEKNVSTEKNIQQQNISPNANVLQVKPAKEIIFDAIICKPVLNYTDPVKK